MASSSASARSVVSRSAASAQGSRWANPPNGSPPPQRQCRVDEAAGLDPCVPASRLAGAIEEPLELDRVDLVRGVQDPARRPAYERRRSHGRPDPRDVCLQRPPGRGRRVPLPERGDQLVAGGARGSAGEQDRQHRPLLVTGQVL